MPRGLYSPYAAWKLGILEDPYAGGCIIARGKVGTRSCATGGPTTGHRARLVLGLLAYSKLQVPELGFPVSLILPLWPQTISILASRGWVGQHVASDTLANRSVSTRIYSQRLGSCVFICPLVSITLVVMVLKRWNQSPGVRVQSGGPLRGSRVVERRTVPPMTTLKVVHVEAARQ
jgi:hypothetical protein